MDMAPARKGLSGLVVLSILGLTACGEEEVAAPPPPIRAIKYMVLKKGVEKQQRRISGVITAGTTSNAAFETTGQVIELVKNVGDQVDVGELIAKLDPEPFKLRLQEAESKLQQAQAALSDGQSKFKQQQQLFRKGYATRTSYESSIATLRNAEGAIGIAQSQLKIAKRNLSKADLLAPFSGVVAKRSVEVFEAVTSGAVVYTLQTQGESEVDVSLPETLINFVSIGDKVEVIVSLLGTEPLAGRLTEIAPLSEDVNAYPVTVLLTETSEGLRPGMSAQVVFEFKSDETVGGFTIPIAALKALPGQEGGAVFVFADGTVKEHSVEVVGLRDNSLQIKGDIKDGDVIATAGVSLLFDGMQARLLDPSSLQ